MQFKTFQLQIDLKLLIPAVLVYILSALTIFSTAPSLLSDHLTYFFIGLVIFFLMSSIDYQIYIKHSFKLFFVVIFLLIITYILGHSALGAVRWLRVGDYTIQPSEISKVVIALVAAKILTENRKIFSIKFLPPPVLKILNNRFSISFFVFLPIFVLVLAQPDLGTSLSVFFIYFLCILFSSFDKRIIFFLLLIGGIISQPIWNSLKPYQKERVLVFINPEKDRYGTGYNSIQAMIAVGSGGVWGKGFQKGTQTQLNFLPIYWTDFLVATYAEERGLVGLIFLLVIYSFFLLYQIKILQRTKNPTLKILGIGSTSYFFFQFIVNFGMNIGLLPVTGIPFPFFSYGGTSLITSFIFLSFLNKISNESKI
jgi:rod shape determining protein RodA